MRRSTRIARRGESWGSPTHGGEGMDGGVMSRTAQDVDRMLIFGDAQSAREYLERGQPWSLASPELDAHDFGLSLEAVGLLQGKGGRQIDQTALKFHLDRLLAKWLIDANGA